MEEREGREERRGERGEERGEGRHERGERRGERREERTEEGASDRDLEASGDARGGSGHDACIEDRCLASFMDLQELPKHLLQVAS